MQLPAIDMRLAPRAVAALLSLLLHVLILSVIVHVANALIEAPGPPEHEPTADKLRGAGERIARVELRPGLAPSGLPCAGSSYVGVGVTADPRTERIMMVGDDTPASRAGLQHDDIVLNPAVWSDSHEEGVVLRVRVLREGATLIVPVRVAKICID